MIADVVILSKASTEVHRRMTQHAIDTCWEGSRGLVNIYVIEQVADVEYQHASTIWTPGEFNYNRSCNIGAKVGTSSWIVFANNDLAFEEGWLDRLIEADHLVVSPVDPNRRSQRSLQENTLGFDNGLHFSGWCFMMKRSVWEDIGMLDEEFIFWCADDSVIEQVRQLGITPMLVHQSRVRHLVSQTMGPHGGREDDGRMTWAMVWKFEHKYGPHRLRTDPRYHRWQRKYVM